MKDGEIGAAKGTLEAFVESVHLPTLFFFTICT